MRVSEVATSSSTLTLTGTLVSGVYAGPEVVVLYDRLGKGVSSTVLSHEVLHPKNWPLIPGDGSTLILRVASPAPTFELDQTQLVRGQGAISYNSNRADVTSSLNEPGFWALHMWLHAECDELPEPPIAFGLSKDQANKEYERLFERHWDAGVWPFVRLPAGESRYVEIEYAVDVEHQQRVWLGEGNRRVLMGYDSGHFSFPAFRASEVLALANLITAHPSAPILLLPGAYLSAGETLAPEQVTKWLSVVPGIKTEFVAPIRASLLSHVVPEVQWRHDERLGWINNWAYSQRNPKSPMSILTDADFTFIRQFFGD